MSDILPIAGSPKTDGDAAPVERRFRAVREAAGGFEALLYRELIGAMRRAQLDEGLFGSSAGADTLEGLFDLYQDREDGTVYLAIRDEQLGGEYLHFSYVLDGLPALGLFRGNFLWEQVFSVSRHFDRIEFVGENTAFYFDPENAISRASRANISPAVLASEKIVACCSWAPVMMFMIPSRPPPAWSAAWRNAW